MAEKERLSASMWVRVEPSRKAEWEAAADRHGYREFSDFVREAIDAYVQACDEAQERVG